MTNKPLHIRNFLTITINNTFTELLIYQMPLANQSTDLGYIHGIELAEQLFT